MPISTRRALSASVFTPSILPGYWAEWTPFTLANLFQVSDGTTPVTADADPVGYIKDISGNGRNLIQATTTRRFGYKVSIFGVLPGLLTNNGGDADGLGPSDTIATSDMSVMMVVKSPATITGGTAYGFFCAFNSATPDGMHLRIGTAGQFELHARPTDATLATGVSVATSTTYVVGATIRASGTTRTLFVNGTIYTASTATTVGTQAVSLGRDNNNNFNNPYTGWLGPGVIFNQAQADSNMLRLTDYYNRLVGAF